MAMTIITIIVQEYQIKLRSINLVNKYLFCG